MVIADVAQFELTDLDIPEHVISFYKEANDMDIECVWDIRYKHPAKVGDQTCQHLLWIGMQTNQLICCSQVDCCMLF